MLKLFEFSFGFVFGINYFCAQKHFDFFLADRLARLQSFEQFLNFSMDVRIAIVLVEEVFDNSLLKLVDDPGFQGLERFLSKPQQVLLWVGFTFDSK